MRRLFPGFVALLILAGCDGGGGGGAFLGPQGAEREQSGGIEPYQGLGTWVDVYDFVPGFQPEGEVPDVTPRSAADMRRLGIETLYLQAAQDDPRSPGDTVDRALLGRFLRAAHRAGLDVVAWYLPRFGDVAADLRRIQALLDFESGGEQFDGLALDIEWVGTVPDAAARNAALVDLSNQVRQAAGERSIGAIVLDPVHLEVVNQAYWPDFPWRDLVELYDVWLPMTYWTNRDESSGYRDGFAYTDENLRRLRRNLGDDGAPVHPIGGIGDKAGSLDYEGFVRAAREHAAVGWSVYDFDVTASSVWPRLRG